MKLKKRDVPRRLGSVDQRRFKSFPQLPDGRRWKRRVGCPAPETERKRPRLMFMISDTSGLQTCDLTLLLGLGETGKSRTDLAWGGSGLNGTPSLVIGRCEEDTQLFSSRWWFSWAWISRYHEIVVFFHLQGFLWNKSLLKQKPGAIAFVWHICRVSLYVFHALRDEISRVRAPAVISEVPFCRSGTCFWIFLPKDSALAGSQDGVYSLSVLIS